MRIKVINTQPWFTIIGAAVWPPFVMASIATMLFFSTFDPTELQWVATFPYALSRTAGYSIGFFGFWLLGISCSSLTLMLSGAIKVKQTQ